MARENLSIGSSRRTPITEGGIMTLKGAWPVGGRRQTGAQRAEILTLYLADPEAAALECLSRGLSSQYAYKIAHERGLIPRERKYWSHLREVVALAD
jgi:hypothetical protein